jgi:hypothetical protein
MKLKTLTIEGKTYAELADGKPVYIHDDGKEIAFDAPGTVATISRLNGEAKGHRERAEEALKTLKAFEGIDDAKAAIKALETVKNLDAKKLVDAGEVEKVRAEAIKAVEEKYAPVIGERDSLKAALVSEKVGGAFSRSKMIAEKLAIPPDMVEARFGSAFKVEGSDVVAYDAGGNKLYSRGKPGEVAGFDEALEILIDQYPYKDHILKSSGASGSGARGAGGANGGSRTMTRAQFDALDAAGKADAAKAAAAGSVVISD